MKPTQEAAYIEATVKELIIESMEAAACGNSVLADELMHRALKQRAKLAPLVIAGDSQETRLWQ